jgi:ribosomal-protein-alanine N-acetyltransferase
MNNIEVFIRPMRVQDIDAVVEIDQRSFNSPWPRQSFEFEVSKSDAAHSWIAEINKYGQKKIVGMAVFWLLVDQAHLATIAVHENYRRMGIAGQIIRTALVKLKNLGALSAMLEVREGNLAAQVLYSQFGFKNIGKRANYYRDNGENAILMTLSYIDEGMLERKLDKNSDYIGG